MELPIAKIKTLTVLVSLFMLLLAAACGGGEEEVDTSNREEGVVVGGFAVVGPNGEVTDIPAVRVERSDIETYLETVRPILEDTRRDLYRQINPSAELQNQTLTLSIEVESIKKADAAVEEGLEALLQVEPPERLEPIHEHLVASYEDVVPAYDNLLEAFNSGDINELNEAAQSSLPEIAQFNETIRSILQELDRAEGLDVGQDTPSERRDAIEGTSAEEETTVEGTS